MKKVVLLVRVSTIYQDYDAQKAELIEYAKGDGYAVGDMEIVEDKESATKLPDEERQGLNKMYAAIDDPENRIECVYCWELSRLSRRPQSLYRVRDILLEKKIDLRTKHEHFKLLNDKRELDANSNIMLGFYIAMCENEIHQKVERTRRIKKVKAKEGKYTGGIILYGYDYDRVTMLYRVNEEQAVVIRAVFTLYETGKYGVITLFKEMLKRGYAIKFHQINRILNSVEYVGGEREEYTTVQKRKTRGKDRVIHRYTRYYPPIITREQYDKCREVATKNNRNVDKSKNVYYAAKLIRCNSCGSFLVASKNSCQYQCQEKYSVVSHKNCAGTDRININVIDSLLWHLAKKKEADFFEREAEKQITENELKRDELQLKVDSIEKRKNALWDKHRKQMIKLFPRKTENEINRLTDDAMEDETRAMEAERVAWMNEMERLDKMTGELLQRNDNLGDVEQLREEIIEFRRGVGFSLDKDKVDRSVERWLNLRRNFPALLALNKIEDEQVIYDMVHRHIKEVRVENVADVDRPEISVKKVTVQYYSGRNDVLYYHSKAYRKEHSVYRLGRPIGYLPGGKVMLNFGYRERFKRS